MRIYVIGVLFFALQVGSTEAQSTTVASAINTPRIISFKREAEKAIGKSIRISYADNLGPDAGNSHCEDNPVKIQIDKKFDHQTQELLVAHELGHVMVCSRHIDIKLTYYPSMIPPRMTLFLDGLASQIKTCYIDPLANAEAEKRGFAIKNLKKLTTDYLKSVTKTELRHSIETHEEFAIDFSALSIYCLELRENKRIPEAEAYISDEPGILSKLESLRSNMGTPSCNDEFSCYFLSKRLRDQFTWGRYFQLQNPTSGVPE